MKRSPVPLALALLSVMLTACGPAPTERETTRAARPGALLHADGFDGDLAQWIVEQRPGGTVRVDAGRLVIEDVGGCTVWFHRKLEAPVIISYNATVAAEPRTSDLNCFWMATDPVRPGLLFEPGHGRDGAFASYDSLRTYYVGYGGNTNTTTRFRRYSGGGEKPLLPEHDLSDPAVLLVPDHTYRIELIVIGDRVQFVRDGEVVFDHTDPEPLHEGWFGFRTVWSKIEFSDFQVHRAEAVP
ncbi:hypothetical protein ASA1KI_29790 [Opitutales bacterium ASA1]|uniref:DUF6250 domain-containing protein n=1 Tax=Congregicoccus parvus TaxID=3081749 RepID=UPI002B2D031F|nr:hypothetical protein ASA1KI_29790 [Opitutales bacterium ASA1]